MSLKGAPAVAPDIYQPHGVAKVDGDAAVDALLQQYEDEKLASREIEQFFVWPEAKRPDIVHDRFDVELPVIDLSPVLKLRRLRKEVAQLDGQVEMRRGVEEEIEACEAAEADVQREIRAACEEYGFFQIVNHGFPMNLVEQLSECCLQMFDLPLEEKMKVTSNLLSMVGKPPPSGYNPMKRSNVITKVGNSHIWNEGFEMESPEVSYPGQMAQIASTLWPEEPQGSVQGLQWRSGFEEYAKQSSSLTYLLLDLMVASLGLPEGSVEGLLGYSPETLVKARLRINHYPVCAQPELTWGVYGHTDPSIITVLHQDDVGGLQIKFRDGTWHGLRPVPGAFVVNVGDYVQAWSNGRFISALHRVVANKTTRRLSIAYFARCDDQTTVSPRPELVDAEHPLQYRPFSRIDYIQALRKYGLSTDEMSLLDKAFRPETPA